MDHGPQPVVLEYQSARPRGAKWQRPSPGPTRSGLVLLDEWPDLTIPPTKLTIDVLSAYASAAGTVVPKIAAMIQTPTIRPETIMELAASGASRRTPAGT